jgi:hypothetical protein
VFGPPGGLIPAGQNPPSISLSQFSGILRRAGKSAVFAAEEFFYGRIRNEHTRAAYFVAVKQFLAWSQLHKIELTRVTPRDVGEYLDGLRKRNVSIATRKQHLAALRHFFDALVTMHAMVLNPALSVRGERYQVVEGKTPEITVKGASACAIPVGFCMGASRRRNDPCPFFFGQASWDCRPAGLWKMESLDGAVPVSAVRSPGEVRRSCVPVHAPGPATLSGSSFRPAVSLSPRLLLEDRQSQPTRIYQTFKSSFVSKR